MAIPIVYQAKGMTVRLLISIALFGVVFAAMLVSFDGITFRVSNLRPLKNETLLLIKEILSIVIFDESDTGRIPRCRSNESRWGHDKNPER
ncbi:hypothetical protein ACS0TY_025315 [Phlomoides rotata]